MTPTREQVVQWADQSGLSLMTDASAPYYMSWPEEQEEFATLARADLEATIAEQAAEIERLRVIERYVQKGETYSYGIRVGIESKAEEFAQLRQQLTEQAAHIERLRECLINIQNNPHKTNWIIDWCAEALSIPSSADALREHDANLVESFRSEILSELVNTPLSQKITWGEFYARKAQEFADKIRKGEF